MTTQIASSVRLTSRRSPYRRALAWLIRTQATLAWWFAGGLAVLWTAAVIAVNAFGEIEMSLMQFARQGAGVWFPFSIAISFCAAALAPHIAVGTTRRVFASAAISTAVAMGALYGGIITAGFAVEGAIYRASGWEQTITDVSWSFVDVSNLGAVAADATLIVAVAGIGGLLVGAVYLRFGPWRGTLSLPLTAGPLLLALAALSRGVEIDGLVQPARFAVVIGIGLLLAAAFHAVIRTIPVPPPKS